MLERLKENQKLGSLFKLHKVRKAYLFGSALTFRFSGTSDVDFLVQMEENIPPVERGELLWSLEEALFQLLNRKIDLITEKSLKNPFFIEELNQTKQLIYGN